VVQEVEPQFKEELKKIEKLVSDNINSLSNETLTNVAYYFCKFQHGDEGLWTRLE